MKTVALVKALLITGVALAAALCAPLRLPAKVQEHPAPAQVPTNDPLAHDILDFFNPIRWPGAPVSSDTGTIVAYHVIDDLMGVPQRTEMLFLPEHAFDPEIVYVRMPLYVNGKRWFCSVPASESLYRHLLGICPTLPPDIQIGRSLVFLREWSVRSCVKTGVVSHATDSIETVGAARSPGDDEHGAGHMPGNPVTSIAIPAATNSPEAATAEGLESRCDALQTEYSLFVPR